MLKAETINRLFNGVPFAVLALAALVASSLLPVPQGGGLASAGSGFCFGTSGLRVDNAMVAAVANCLALAGIGALTYFLNKRYSFVRSITLLPASVFLLLEAANPDTATSLTDGALIALLILASAFILLGTFGKPRAQRSVFITFVLISLAAMFHSACLYLVFAFFVGFVQMRVMTVRGVLAMLLGLAFPYWIVLGLGIASPAELRLPAVAAVWGGSGPHLQLLTAVSIVLSALLFLALITINLMHIYSYKSHTRAYNGFFIILALLTLIAMAVDYGNILNYLTILNLCVAIQVAHTFTISVARHRYLALVALLLLCVAARGVPLIL